jgi:hypothetical protein
MRTTDESRTSNSDETVKFMPHGEEQLQAMAKILIWKGSPKIVPLFIRPLSLTTIPVIKDGDLAEEFRTGEKML